MKTYQLFLLLSFIIFGISDDSDQCTIDFEAILKGKCEGINSCSFNVLSDHSTRCISTNNNGCSRGNNDNDLCSKIFPNTFPKQRCKMQSDSTNCIAENNKCTDFNNPLNGVAFDPIKDRAICDAFTASDGRRCRISDYDSILTGETSLKCKEFYTDCTQITSQSNCEKNLIDYTTTCRWDGSCKPDGVRKCDMAINSVTEDECSQLQSTDPDKKCVYFRGTCHAEYVSCEKYDIDTCVISRSPLIQKENAYYFDDSKYCDWITPTSGTAKCEPVYKSCTSYTGSDSTVCQYLKVSDSTNKRCVYDPTRTTRVCREVYNTCQLFNDKEIGKSRSGGCEKNILADPTKKCIYIEETDKCIETDLYSTCADYKGSDKYICESIRSSTTHSKCILEKDRICTERIFNCTEAFNEEDCLYYAKPEDSRKICVYSGDQCREVYKNCEDYLQTDTTTSCLSLTLYNGNQCYLESNSNTNTKRCRSRKKTCEMATNKDECKIIAESGVSDPDKRVCDYVLYSGSYRCIENYKYCSDYRGTDAGICTNIKPYDESGKNIDITSKCQYTTTYGCERVTKECTDIDVADNPILCSLISHKIQNNNIMYCAFVGGNCQKYFKTCESYTNTITTSLTCETNIPQNYLTTGFCGIDSNGKCVTIKKECELFNVDDYEYLCKNMPNVTYYSRNKVCVRKSTPDSCKDVKFLIASDENEEVCKNLETESPNTICSLNDAKSGCIEILNKTMLQTTTTNQDISSFLMIKGIHFIMLFLYLLF